MIGALLVVLGITYLLLLTASHVQRVMGVTGLNVVNRVFGVLVTALAVQFMFDGIRQKWFIRAWRVNFCCSRTVRASGTVYCHKGSTKIRGQADPPTSCRSVVRALLQTSRRCGVGQPTVSLKGLMILRYST